MVASYLKSLQHKKLFYEQRQPMHGTIKYMIQSILFAGMQKSQFYETSKFPDKHADIFHKKTQPESRPLRIVRVHQHFHKKSILCIIFELY